MPALNALKENAEIIAAAGKRIAGMVPSLKNFTRLDEAEYHRASIHEGIDSALTLLQSELRDRVTAIKESEEIPEICCFPGQFNHVFMSLLKNASDPMVQE